MSVSPRGFRALSRPLTLVPVVALGLLAPTSAVASSAPAASANVSTTAAVGSWAAKSSAVPAKPSRACRKRQLNLRKPVPAKLFAQCVVTGMKRGSTATVTTRHTPGVTSTGPSRFTSRTDASVTYSDGARLVMLGGKGWYKAPGRPWARPGTATEDQMTARLVVSLWNATATDRGYQQPLRASSTGWKATGGVRTVNGIRAREYRGTVTLGAVTYSRYSVWVDALDRPVRIQSVGSAYGQTVKSRQDFKGWGRKVAIKPPKMR